MRLKGAGRHANPSSAGSQGRKAEQNTREERERGETGERMENRLFHASSGERILRGDSKPHRVAHSRRMSARGCRGQPTDRMCVVVYSFVGMAECAVAAGNVAHRQHHRVRSSGCPNKPSQMNDRSRVSHQAPGTGGESRFQITQMLCESVLRHCTHPSPIPM